MILLYHLVFPDSTPANTWNAGLVLRIKDFQRQMLWLKRFYQIVSLDEYVNQMQNSEKPRSRLAALSFDDCYCHTFQLVSPFLEVNDIPATFFANTLHLEQNSLLWFVYFNALCFEKVYPELIIEGLRYPLTTQNECYSAWQKLINLAKASEDARVFSQSISRNYPLPDEIVARYQGLSEEQLRQVGASHIFSLGGHTHSHPYLDQISSKEQFEEMVYNKKLLEIFANKTINHFAYTAGIYNMDSIIALKSAGFKTGFAIRPRNLSSDVLCEIPRTEVYGATILKFLVKISGIMNDR